MANTPTTSSGSIVEPNGTTGFNRTAYAAGYERALYQRTILVNYVEEGERLMGGMVIRKAQRVAAATLAQSSDGTGIVYVNPVGTPVTVNPVGLIVPIGWSRNQQAQVDINMERLAGDSSADALSELVETNTAANFTSGTQVISNAIADAATLRAAQSLLTGNTNGGGLADPNRANRIYGFFSNTQMAPLMSIPEVNSAEMRGDSENPYVTGLWVKGFGMVLNISTVVALNANGYHNAVFLAQALTVRWNERPSAEQQTYEYRKGYYGYCNVGSAVVHDLRMVVVRTT